MSIRFRRILRLLAAALLLVSAVACGKKGAKLLESSSTEKTAVMTIDGYDVPLELYRYVALNYKNDYESGRSSDIWLGEEGAALLAELNEDVKETLVYLYSTVSLAGQYGIRIDDRFITDTVDRQMDGIYEEYEDNYQAYVDYLRAYNMTDSVYRFFVRNDILAEELIAKMAERGEIPTDDASLRAVLQSDEVVRVKQILLTDEDGRSDEEHEAEAEAILARLNAGEDFDELVQKEGRDLFMFNNSDGYYLSRGTYHREFEDAAFSLAVGQTSGVVRSDAGWSILRRYEKDQSYLDTHFDDLADDYIAGQYNIRLEAHEASLADRVSELPALSGYTIFNLETTY